VSSRLRARLALLQASASLGCMLGPLPGVGPLEPVFDAYNRNKIVCTPVAAGNLVGLAVGAVPTLVIAPPVIAIDEEAGMATLFGIPAAFASLFGGLFGTPFLPFAYLAPERNCAVDMR
jgi:hypothetical protein